MLRCLFISAVLHCGLIVGLLLLGLFAPPTKTIKIPDTFKLNLNNRGIPGLPPGNPKPLVSPNPVPEPMPAEPVTPEPTAAPEKKEEPAPTPVATPQPTATPAPPKPPTRPPIVQPKTTPEPKPEEVKKVPPTLKKTNPTKKVVEAPLKKKIVMADKKKLIEVKHTPVPTPTPEPTPEEAPATVVSEEPVVPQDRQVAEFAGNLPPVPVVPPVASAPAPTPIVPAVGSGGKGKGQFISRGGSLTGGISGPPGGGGGSGGNGPGYGYGSLLSSLAQTYFAIVLQRIEENFKLPYSRPGVQCEVQFVIEKDGHITNIQKVKGTGFENLDYLAVQALEATRLPPLYDGMQVSSLPVVITFNYEKKF